MPSILIAGLPKTGTTGLYNAVKEATASSDDYAYLFEPKDPLGLLSLTRYVPQRPILTKIMVHRLDDCAVRYGDFDHRLMTVRDPRDVVISRLLFRPMFGSTAYRLPIEKLEPFVEALREKEAEPGSRSVRELHELADDLGMSGGGWGAFVKQMNRQRELTADHGFTLVYYEDFVQGKLDELSEELGVQVTNPRAQSSGGWLDHITRSLGSGEWRHWFLSEDVDYYRDMFSDYTDAYGYDDWDLATEPEIDPATSSEYVNRKVHDYIEEAQQRRQSWSVDAVSSQDDLDHVRGMAEDGRAHWAYRLAKVHLEGDPQFRDPATAEHWCTEAAVRGYAPAMRLLAELREQSDQREAIVDARRWRCEHDRLVGKQRETDLTGQQPELGGLRGRLAKLQRELDEAQDRIEDLESSGRYRAGTMLSQAARDPLRRGFPALWKLLKLALQRALRRH